LQARRVSPPLSYASREGLSDCLSAHTLHRNGAVASGGSCRTIVFGPLYRAAEPWKLGAPAADHIVLPPIPAAELVEIAVAEELRDSYLMHLAQLTLGVTQPLHLILGLFGHGDPGGSMVAGYKDGISTDKNGDLLLSALIKEDILAAAGRINNKGGRVTILGSMCYRGSWQDPAWDLHCGSDESLLTDGVLLSGSGRTRGSTFMVAHVAGRLSELAPPNVRQQETAGAHALRRTFGRGKVIDAEVEKPLPALPVDNAISPSPSSLLLSRQSTRSSVSSVPSSASTSTDAPSLGCSTISTAPSSSPPDHVIEAEVERRQLVWRAMEPLGHLGWKTLDQTATLYLAGDLDGDHHRVRQLWDAIEVQRELRNRAWAYATDRDLDVGDRADLEASGTSSLDDFAGSEAMGAGLDLGDFVARSFVWRSIFVDYDGPARWLLHRWRKTGRPMLDEVAV
jgi:hypothetical protein